MSKIFCVIIFRVKYFSDKRPCTALPLIVCIICFHAFNFHISQASRKYFNNEIFAIYGIILYIEYFQPSNVKGCMAGAV